MSSVEIQVAATNGVTHVKVAGRATFACSKCLRDYTLNKIDEGFPVIQFDLAECEGMDSTFMGVLAMLALRTRGQEGRVDIVNACDKAHRSLQGLGISGLFRFTEADTSREPWSELDESPGETESARRAVRATMLEAHETLGQVNPDNISKFKDVLEFLREEETQDG
jgi:anti-anti-sigma regulatory factor